VKPVKKLKPGSRSHGTLKTDDLLEACYGVLQEIVDEGHHGDHEHHYEGVYFNMARCLGYVEILREYLTEDHPHTARVEDEAREVLTEVMDFLEEHHVPESHYFGMHPGDGSDLGVWENDL
jgi:hypothetical protein